MCSWTTEGVDMAKIITANMLATGAVVFLGAGGEWVRSVNSAVEYRDESAAEDGLALALRDQARAVVVDPFVTDKTTGTGDKPAMTLRDTIRAFGPTIRYRPAGMVD
jgi:hypothetical protein